MAHLICTQTQKTYSLNAPIWHSDSGDLLDIVFEAQFDLPKIQSRPPTMWRYREAIPLENDDNIVSFKEGFTSLVPWQFGQKEVLLKQDQLFLSGSYKDRGASVLISQVKTLGLKAVVEDSSGNAGCAIAAYCARAGIACDIYVPADTSPGKLTQIQLYGATLVKTPGSREATAQAVLAAAQSTYYASHSWNPFFFHGTKTFAYEVCEQLGWREPDVVILPVGNGTLLLGVDIGFQDLLRAGIISKMPKLIAVQAENCAPLAQAFARPEPSPLPFIQQETLAEGIAIAEPIRAKQILTAVQNSGGGFITVTEAEIKASLLEMAQEGFYIEPTSAATTAGVRKYVEEEQATGVVVSVLTGHGLKATEKVLKLI